MDKEKFKKAIIAFFTKNTGLTINQAKKEIRKTMYIDNYGNIHNNSISFSNVKVFYTNNPNYCNGVKNGYGAGWYISNSGFTGGSTVKLSVKM